MKLSRLVAFLVLGVFIVFLAAGGHGTASRGVVPYSKLNTHQGGSFVGSLMCITTVHNYAINYLTFLTKYNQILEAGRIKTR